MSSVLQGTTRSVSAIEARSHLGQILDRAESEPRPLVVHKNGVPKAVILSIQEYIRLAAPEPKILREVGEGSKRRGTDKLSPKAIEGLIREVREVKRSRNSKRPRNASSQARS